MTFDDIILPHAGRVALQLSGGKDSIATAMVMRPWWAYMRMYWVDTGSAFPEVRESVARIAQMGAEVVVIHADQPGCVRAHGYPSDLVPVTYTPMGLLASGSDKHPIQSRYDCCSRVLWGPMLERMQADGITLIIRGEKASDHLRGGLKSGDVVNGVEYLFPIEPWTDSDVMSYLRAEGVEIPRFYGMMKSSPDCMDCSAWWDENRAAYLRAHHPEAHERYMERLSYIGGAVQEHCNHINTEFGVSNG